MTKKKVYEPVFDADVGTLVRAGQDFVAGHCWITIPFCGRSKDDDELVRVAFYLNDAGELVHANKDVDGLYFIDVPMPEERWEKDDLKGWISGGRNSLMLKELVEKVAALYSKYAEYVHPFEPKFFALWSIATYFCQLFDNFPIIFLTGLKGTGKSRTGKVTAFTAFNGYLSPNISSAAMFRHIDEKKGTIIIDEKESLGESAKEMKDKDMESVLNGGDKKGATVERCELDIATKKMMQRKFEIYSPKMICNVYGGLSSETITNRCITIVMQRAMHDVTINEPDERCSDFVNIRCNLYRYMMAHWKDVEKNYFKSDFKGNRRAVTIWKPLVVLAGMVGDELQKELLDYMEESIKEAEIDEGETIEMRLLMRLHEIVTETRYYSLGEITGMLGQDLHWQDYTERKHGYMMKKLGLKEKKHTNHGVMYLLSPNKVVEVMKRIGVGVLKSDVSDEVTMKNTPLKGLSEGMYLTVTSSPSSLLPESDVVKPIISPDQTSLTSLSNRKASDEVTMSNFDMKKTESDGKTSSSEGSSSSPLIDEVPSDNNGTLAPSEQNPEPSGLFPDVEWFLTGICSSCGVNNQTTMHEGKQLCKLCYFELKSDELDKGENIDGSINPCSDSKEQEVR